MLERQEVIIHRKVSLHKLFYVEPQYLFFCSEKNIKTYKFFSAAGGGGGRN